MTTVERPLSAGGITMDLSQFYSLSASSSFLLRFVFGLRLATQLDAVYLIEFFSSS